MEEIVNHKYNFRNKYMITEDGKVYSCMYNKFLFKWLDKDGYEKITLCCTDGKRHAFSVHRLVMETYCPIDNPSNMQINHKDGNKTNNSVENLEWCTCAENINHACKTKLRKDKGEDNNSANLTEKDVFDIIDLILSKKYTYKQIGEMYNVCEETIGRIKRKEKWSHLTQNIVF